MNYENQYIRVLEVTLQPGESSLFHTHSTDVVIVTLSEALARSQKKGNAWEAERALRAGMVSVDRAERTPHTHHLQNVGTTVFRTLNIEILPVLP